MGIGYLDLERIEKSLERTVRRQKLFVLSVFVAITELLIFFSISVNIWPEIPTIVLGFLFLILNASFGVYYFVFVQGLGSLFPFVEPLIIESIPGIDNQTESSRLSINYYMDRYSKYLKKKVTSPFVADPLNPHIIRIVKPIEYYYFEQEALNLFDADEQARKTEKTGDFRRNPFVEQQDALYLVLLTGVAYCSTVVNLFLGRKILAASLPFLLCIFFVPFYHGYLKGALRDNFGKRIEGWESLILISVIFPIISISFLYLLPNLYFSILMFMHQWIMRCIYASCIMSFQVIALVMIGVVGFALVLGTIHLAVILARPVAIELTKYYFDSSPTRRQDILRGITYDPRLTKANQVLSAMLHRIETELVLGNETVTIQNSMVNSEKLIRGSYEKGWTWFMSTYLLCFGLTSVFVLLMHIF